MRESYVVKCVGGVVGGELLEGWLRVCVATEDGETTNSDSFTTVFYSH